MTGSREQKNGFGTDTIHKTNEQKGEEEHGSINGNT